MQEIDNLTKLYSDSYLKTGLKEEVLRSERYERPLGLLLLQPDIPDAKHNDHIYRTLKRLGSICREHTRNIDQKVRWKNQVLVVLPETDLEGIRITGFKIREIFEKAFFVEDPLSEDDMQDTMRFSLTVKVLCYKGKEGASPEKLLQELEGSPNLS